MAEEVWERLHVLEKCAEEEVQLLAAFLQGAGSAEPRSGKELHRLAFEIQFNLGPGNLPEVLARWDDIIGPRLRTLFKMRHGPEAIARHFGEDG